MDENDIKLLDEIESLKSQIAELRMALAGMENAGGAAVGIGEMLVPIGQLVGRNGEILTNAWPPGGSSRAKMLGDVLLTVMRDANNNADTNIKFDLSEDANTDTTTIKIGVYYL